MTNDLVWRSYLDNQLAATTELAAHSDLLAIEPIFDPLGLPVRYRASLRCTSALRGADGRIEPAESDFAVGITLFEHHLKYVDPLRVVTWLGPMNISHPNIRPPVTCIGHVFPGIEVTDLLYSVFEMLGFYNWASDDALNEEAAQWARNHQHLFPLERRPLRRRTSRRGQRRQGG